MKDIRLISSKIITAELYQDFNIDNDDWVNKINRHIERALGLMRIDGFYIKKTLIEDVEEFKAPLPCDAKYVMAVLYNQGCLTRLPLTRHVGLGVNFAGITAHTTLKGAIENNYLHTNFEKGKIMYVYYGVPLDDCGDILIPDCPEVLEALPYFIIQKLSLSGYKHPIIDYKMAKEEWRTLYPIARNKMNYWSIEEAHQFTKMNTNPLFIDIIDEEWNTGEETYNTNNLGLNLEANQSANSTVIPSDFVLPSVVEHNHDEVTISKNDFDNLDYLYYGGIIDETKAPIIIRYEVGNLANKQVAYIDNNQAYSSLEELWLNKSTLNYI